MRGGTLRQGGLPSLSEKREGDGGLLTTPGKRDAEVFVEDEDGRTASNHTPSNSPPKESVLHHRRAADEDGENEEGSSAWEPYAESRTPTLQHMEGKNGFLQPTVEEYYSELTPARAASTQAAKFSTGRGEREEQHSPSKSEPLQSEGRASSPPVSPQRSPVFQRSAPQPPHSHETTLQQELEQLRAQCQHLQNLNTSLTQTINSERRQRQEETTAHEAQLADFARREHDLAEMKAQSHQHKEDFRREFSNLKEQIQKYESQHQTHLQDLQRLKREHASSIQDLKAQLERERQELKHELRSLEQDIELARRSRDDAEDSARANREELDERAADVDRLKMEIQQGEELREGIKEQLRSAKMENERLEGVKKAKEDVEAELDLVRRRKDGEVERREAEHGGVIEGLRKEVEEVKKDAEEQRMMACESSASESLQKEVESLRKSYNTTLVERDALQDELTATQEHLATERSAREAEKEDVEAVNAALSVRISGAIRVREEYWRDRLSDMEDELAAVAEERRVLAEERRVMAKALLRGWGREEMGVGVGVEDGEDGGGIGEGNGQGFGESGWQLYEYLFAVANGDGNGNGNGKGRKGRVTFREGRDSMIG